jgi:hypothetical protein
MLKTGTYATIVEIAAAGKINESYVGRVPLRAPDILGDLKWAAAGGVNVMEGARWPWSCRTDDTVLPYARFTRTALYCSSPVESRRGIMDTLVYSQTGSMGPEKSMGWARLCW